MGRYSYPLPGGAKIEVDAATKEEATEKLKARFDQLQSGGGLGDYVGSFLQGATFGYGDEAVGFGEALFTGEDDMSFWDEYEMYRDREREAQKAFTETNPVKSFGTEALGAVVGPGKFLGAGKTALGTAGMGAAGGGLYATGKAEGEIDPVDVALGAGLGAGGNLLGRAVGDVVGKSKALAKASRQTDEIADALKQSADDGFNALRRTNAQISDSTGQIAQVLRAAADRAGYIDDGGYTAVQKILKDTFKQARKPFDYNTYDAIRRRLTAVAQNKTDAQGAIARQMLNDLDETVMGSRGLIANAPALGQLKELRSKWLQVMNNERIAEALAKAEFRASTSGTGGNFINTARQEIAKLIKPGAKTENFFKSNATLYAAMKQFAEGGKLDNFLRWAGRLAPSASSVATTGNVGAGFATGGSSLALSGALEGAKRLGEARSTMALDAMRRMAMGVPAAAPRRSLPTAGLNAAIGGNAPGILENM